MTRDCYAIAASSTTTWADDRSHSLPACRAHEMSARCAAFRHPQGGHALNRFVKFGRFGFLELAIRGICWWPDRGERNDHRQTYAADPALRRRKHALHRINIHQKGHAPNSQLFVARARNNQLVDVLFNWLLQIQPVSEGARPGGQSICNASVSVTNVLQRFHNGLRIELQDLSEFNEFDHIDPPLATLEPSNKGLVLAEPCRKLRLRHARVFACLNEQFDQLIVSK